MIRLPQVVHRPKKRVGRGMGSGKGSHTSGRGQKGQGARTDIKVLFEGVKMKKTFIKRLPLQRGKGKFHASPGRIAIKAERLESIPAGSVITIDLLVKSGIIKERYVKSRGVKIVGIGENKNKFKFSVPTSKLAVVSEKVIKAREVTKKN